jgi:hypothetical protein
MGHKFDSWSNFSGLRKDNPIEVIMVLIKMAMKLIQKMLMDCNEQW